MNNIFDNIIETILSFSGVKEEDRKMTKALIAQVLGATVVSQLLEHPDLQEEVGKLKQDLASAVDENEKIIKMSEFVTSSPKAKEIAEQILVKEATALVEKLATVYMRNADQEKKVQLAEEIKKLLEQ